MPGGSGHRAQQPIRRRAAHPHRCARAIARQGDGPWHEIASGQEYARLKPVVGVHLPDFDLFEGHASARWHFEMRDRQDPTVRLGDELHLHVVELRKADRLRRRAATGAPRPDSLAAWVAFLEHWQEITTMAGLQYPPVREAMKKLEELSLSEEERFGALSPSAQAAIAAASEAQLDAWLDGILHTPSVQALLGPGGR